MLNVKKKWILEGFLDPLPTIAKENPPFCILGKEFSTPQTNQEEKVSARGTARSRSEEY
jgi:hypothetical protein